VIDDFLKVFAVNLQAIPNLCDIIESSNELILVVWVAIKVTGGQDVKWTQKVGHN
jgi:hypothetical protein